MVLAALIFSVSGARAVIMDEAAELPAPGLDKVQDDEIIGYYSWNWGSGSNGPDGANAGCAFTGYTDVATAISGYTEGAAWCCPELVETKFLTLGGGNAAGAISADDLSDIAGSASMIIKAGYGGVMFDVEEVQGSSSDTVPGFQKAFKKLKKAGLRVGVTTSHSAPYETDSPQDAIDLVKAWCDDDNLDIISPQLYSSGYENSPEFAETSSCADAGCTWDLYKGCKATFAPSIVETSHYSASKTYFSDNYGIKCGGYFQWKQEA